MLRTLSALTLVITAVACVPDNEFAVINVVRRPSVKPGIAVEVEVFRDGSSETQRIPVAADDDTFTASVRRDSTHVVARLFDDDGLVVASGEGPPERPVYLDPAPFDVSVTGTDCALAEAATAGRQMARLDDGSFAVVWQDIPFIRARIFDLTGTAIDAALRGTDGEVRIAPIDPDLLQRTYDASLVSAGDRLVVAHELWSSTLRDVTGEVIVLDRELGVNAIRATDLGATIGVAQLSVAVLPSGNLAVAWVDAFQTDYGVRHLSILGPGGELLSDHVMPGDGLRPQIAAWSGGVIMVSNWIDGIVSKLDIDQFDASGTLVGSPRTIAVDLDAFVSPVRVVAHGDGFLVSWMVYAVPVSIRAALFDGRGEPGKQVEVAQLGTLEGLSVADVGNGDTAIAWSENRGADTVGNGRVMWTVLDGELAPRFPPRAITDAVEAQSSPSILALDSGAFAVAWTQLAPAPGGRGSSVKGRLVYSPLDATP